VNRTTPELFVVLDATVYHVLVPLLRCCNKITAPDKSVDPWFRRPSTVTQSPSLTERSDSDTDRAALVTEAEATDGVGVAWDADAT